MKKRKILHVVGQLSIGGQETMVVNFFRFGNQEKFMYYFLVYGDKIGGFEEELKSKGGIVLHIPYLTEVGYNRFVQLIDKLINDFGPFDIIHCHTSLNSGLILKIAEKNGIPKRIAHSHTTQPGREISLRYFIYSKIARFKINEHATDRIACSTEAGNYLFGKRMFGKKGIIIKNAIDLDSFRFSALARNQLRKQYDFNDCLVVGHVGRFGPEKNHAYLMEVFNCVYKLRPDSRLVLIGVGQLMKSIQEKADQLGISSKVIFTGQRNDIPNLLSMMDVFVFPSLYEGLPVSLIEAQASGLPCFFSDSITKEVSLIDRNEFLSINENPELWAQHILDIDVKTYHRENIDMSKWGYDIRQIVKQIESIYVS